MQTHTAVVSTAPPDSCLLSIHSPRAAAGLPHLALAIVTGSLILAAMGCHGAVISTDPDLKVGGTIAGIVRATDGSMPLVTRKVTAIHAASGARFETTTGVNGGYTIKVPEEGRYRLEVELRDGEVIAKGPEETVVNNGDLDPGRDFEITVAPVARKGSL